MFNPSVKPAAILTNGLLPAGIVFTFMPEAPGWDNPPAWMWPAAVIGCHVIPKAQAGRV